MLNAVPSGKFLLERGDFPTPLKDSCFDNTLNDRIDLLLLQPVQLSMLVYRDTQPRCHLALLRY